MGIEFIREVARRAEDGYGPGDNFILDDKFIRKISHAKLVKTKRVFQDGVVTPDEKKWLISAFNLKSASQRTQLEKIIGPQGRRILGLRTRYTPAKPGELSKLLAVASNMALTKTDRLLAAKRLLKWGSKKAFTGLKKIALGSSDLGFKLRTMRLLREKEERLRYVIERERPDIDYYKDKTQLKYDYYKQQMDDYRFGVAMIRGLRSKNPAVRYSARVLLNAYYLPNKIIYSAIRQLLVTKDWAHIRSCYKPLFKNTGRFHSYAEQRELVSLALRPGTPTDIIESIFYKLEDAAHSLHQRNIIPNDAALALAEKRAFQLKLKLFNRIIQRKNVKAALRILKWLDDSHFSNDIFPRQVLALYARKRLPKEALISTLGMTESARLTKVIATKILATKDWKIVKKMAALAGNEKNTGKKEEAMIDAILNHRPVNALPPEVLVTACESAQLKFGADGVRRIFERILERKLWSRALALTKIDDNEKLPHIENRAKFVEAIANVVGKIALPTTILKRALALMDNFVVMENRYGDAVKLIPDNQIRQVSLALLKRGKLDLLLNVFRTKVSWDSRNGGYAITLAILEHAKATTYTSAQLAAVAKAGITVRNVAQSFYNSGLGYSTHVWRSPREAKTLLIGGIKMFGDTAIKLFTPSVIAYLKMDAAAGKTRYRFLGVALLPFIKGTPAEAKVRAAMRARSQTTK